MAHARRTAAAVRPWRLAVALLAAGGLVPGPARAADDPGQVLQEWVVERTALPPGVSYWQSDTPGLSAEAKAVPAESYPDGTGAVAVQVLSSPCTHSAHLQLNHVIGVSLGRGGRYQASFWARASRETAIDAAVILDDSPWTPLGPTARLHAAIGADWQRFRIVFSPDVDIARDQSIRAPHFGLGCVPPGTTVWLAGMTLAELEPPPPPLPVLESDELLDNPHFAAGLRGWTGQAAAISPIDGPACLVTRRTARWGTPVQDIRAALADHGPGFYQFGATVRKVKGRGATFAVLHFKDANGDHWLTTETRGLNDVAYAQVSACRYVGWSGRLEAADIGVQTAGDNLADIVVGGCSLRALENLARGRVVASSGDAPGRPAALAGDGDPATVWQAVGGQGAWLGVDLGRRVSFHACVLAEEGAHTHSYVLECWDGGRWRTAISGGVILGGVDQLHFAPVTGSKVRLRFTRTDGPPAIGELALYATPIRDATLRVAAPPADARLRGPRTLVGAIRWDGWCGDRSRVGLDLERVMTPERYHYRLPFYARILDDGKVQARCVDQATMDREIAFAREAGIDYWAFDWYPPSDGLSTARSLYLASRQRADVKWCVILNTGSFSDDDRRWLCQRFREANYQTVLGGRPLVYVFEATRRSASFVEALRHAATADRRPTPFVVYMGWGPAVAEPATAGGADAIGAYVNPFAQGASFDRNRVHERSQWEALRATGVQVVPTVTTGWDPRPFADCPVPWYPGAKENNWVERARPEEVAAQLRDGLEFVRSHPPATLANTVLVYAWNENAEGGWLIPTLGELRDADLPARLDAVRGVLRPKVPRGSGWEALCAGYQ